MMHTPKTGGTWAKNVLNSCGYIAETLKPKFQRAHPPSRDVLKEYPGWFSFTFVRFPTTWLQSYWAHAHSTGFTNIDGIVGPMRDLRSPTFHKFLELYLEKCPGEVGRMYQRCTTGVRFIGIFERLRDDLLRALAASGRKVHPWHRQIILQFPAANVMRIKPDKLELITYTEELLYAVLEAEKIFIEKYEEIRKC